MLKLKPLAAVLASVTMLAVSLPADARAGSPSGSRSSIASSRSVAAAPAGTPDRAGGGGSVGMRRSEAMREARSQPPEPTRSYSRATAAPASEPPRNGNSDIIGSNVPRRDGTSPPTGAGDAGGGSAKNYARPAPQVAPRRGWSGAQIAGAAALAGVAGYAMADSRDSRSTTTPSPTAQEHPPVPRQELPAAVADSEPAPRAAAARPKEQATQPDKAAVPGIAVGLLLALLIAGGVFFVFRSLVKRDRNHRPAGHAGTSQASGASSPLTRLTLGPSGPPPADAQSELVREAPELFRRVQDANNRGDLAELAALTDDGELLQYFVSSINERTEVSRTKVLSVSIQGNRVLDFVGSAASFTGSIHFKAEIAEGDDPSEVIEEVWHFLKPVAGGTWKLAGIEQL